MMSLIISWPNGDQFTYSIRGRNIGVLETERSYGELPNEAPHE
jgi:hypothetical protein